MTYKRSARAVAKGTIAISAAATCIGCSTIASSINKASAGAAGIVNVATSVSVSVGAGASSILVGGGV